MTEKQKRKVWVRVCAYLVALLGFLIFFSNLGCSIRSQTVIPRPIVSTQASFDGNRQDSGDVSYEGGYIKSPKWLARYEALLAIYGKRFVPPVKPDDRTGIEPDGANYKVTAEVSARFTRMNTWLKPDSQ